MRNNESQALLAIAARQETQSQTSTNSSTEETSCRSHSEASSTRHSVKKRTSRLTCSSGRTYSTIQVRDETSHKRLQTRRFEIERRHRAAVSAVTSNGDCVTRSAPLPECNVCSECGGSLDGRRKNATRCSTKCRVALHRRLARQGVKDATGALITVANRAFAHELEEQQREARKKKRAKHQRQRQQLREEYRAKSAAMRSELPQSDADIANKF
jgi:hypothetical protein